MQHHLMIAALALAPCVLMVACQDAPSDGEEERASTTSPAEAEFQAVINDSCPRSGDAVAADSLAEYRGHVVGFCNPHCRDDFRDNVAERPDDTGFFDQIIAGLQQDR